MDIQKLKLYILENNKISIILENLGCHHIKLKDGYYTCGNADGGDNPSAITVYKNENITCIDYTRDITQGKNIGTDIFSLVEFFQKCSFFEAIKLVCDWTDIDYYHDFDEDIPESLKITKLIIELQKGNIDNEQEKPLKPISEKILTYYKPYVNEMFKEDGISYTTQRIFEVGYDETTDYITIPIRDELGNLIGVKGRYFYREVPQDKSKYIYLEKCARSQILYGLNLTKNYIKSNKKCFVAEAEKAPMQLWDMGYQNSVGTGGKKITKIQIEKLTRLCVDLIFVFDKDVSKNEIQDIANRFIDGVNIYAIIDDKKILDEKESPTDNKGKFEYLIKKCMYKIK